jgi:hypothetical protein
VLLLLLLLLPAFVRLRGAIKTLDRLFVTMRTRNVSQQRSVPVL